MQVLTAFSFLRSIEFYVIATVVAAAVLALCARPARRAAAKEHRVGGWLVEGDYDTEPSLKISVGADGAVTIRRTGLRDMYDGGSVALMIEQRGFDLDVREVRASSGRGIEPCTEAVFVLTFLGAERYHIKYTADPSSRFAAFGLHVRPGIRQEVRLGQ